MSPLGYTTVAYGRQIQMGGKPSALRVDLARRRITIDEDGRVDQWRIDQVRRASKAYGRSWTVTFHDATRLLSAVPMPPAAASVMLWSLGALHPTEWTTLTQAQIALATGLSRQAVNRAVGHLVDRGVIIHEGRGYRLSIWLCWQGTAQAYQKARRTRSGEIAQAQQWHLERAPAEFELNPTRYFRLVDDTVGAPSKWDVDEEDVI